MARLAETRPWGLSGRVKLITRSYAMYDEVVVDNYKQIGNIWKNTSRVHPEDGWRVSIWTEDLGKGAMYDGPIGSEDMAVRLLLERAAPDILEHENRLLEAADGKGP